MIFEPRKRSPPRVVGGNSEAYCVECADHETRNTLRCSGLRFLRGRQSCRQSFAALSDLKTGRAIRLPILLAGLAAFIHPMNAWHQFQQSIHPIACSVAGLA